MINFCQITQVSFCYPGISFVIPQVYEIDLNENIQIKIFF